MLLCISSKYSFKEVIIKPVATLMWFYATVALALVRTQSSELLENSIKKKINYVNW